jgi:hypothetical protein
MQEACLEWFASKLTKLSVLSFEKKILQDSVNSSKFRDSVIMFSLKKWRLEHSYKKQ